MCSKGWKWQLLHEDTWSHRQKWQSIPSHIIHDRTHSWYNGDHFGNQWGFQCWKAGIPCWDWCTELCVWKRSYWGVWVWATRPLWQVSEDLSSQIKLWSPRKASGQSHGEEVGNAGERCFCGALSTFLLVTKAHKVINGLAHLILINYKGKTSHFPLEKLGRYHLNQMMMLTSWHHHVPPEDTCPKCLTWIQSWGKMRQTQVEGHFSQTTSLYALKNVKAKKLK